MKRSRIIAGLIAVIAVAALGYFLWGEERAPVTVAVTPLPAPEQPSAPTEAVKPAPEKTEVRPPPPQPSEATKPAERPADGQAEVSSPQPAEAVKPPETPVKRQAEVTPRQPAPPVEEMPARPPAPARPAKVQAEVAPRPAQPAAAKPADPQPAEPRLAEPRPAEPQPAEPRAAPTTPPSFDIVRVEPSGEAVIAGRAAPRSTVTVLDGGRSMGEVVADARGQWVLVPRDPLAPGSHELSLEARTEGGDRLQSPNIVVVSVPEPPPLVTAAVGEAEEPAAEAEAPAPGAAAARDAPGAVTETPAEISPSTEVASAMGSEAPTEARQDPAPMVRDPVKRESERPLTGTARGIEQEPIRVLRRAERPLAGAAPGASQGTVRVRLEPERPLVVLMPRSGPGTIRVLQEPVRTYDGLPAGALVLVAVDYDALGMAVIGGRAEPGTRLLVYLDDGPAGRATTAADGQWRARLDRPVPLGLHLLRVDQVDEKGAVVARVESPFSRQALVAGLPDETSVIVQPGNSLWRIARRVYGRGVRYSVIFEANMDQIRDPALIFPGQIFVIPPVE